MLREYYPKYGANKTAELLGRSSNACKVKAGRIGVHARPHFANYDYFENIDSKDKAYWLGFISADGYVVNNRNARNYELGIELAVIDADHLKQFNNCIGGNFEITYREKSPFVKCGYDRVYKMAQIRVYSKKMVQDLEQYGIVQNKTYSLEFPDIEEKYLWDYIRGYFDGDGSFSTYLRNDIVRKEVMIPRVSFVCKNRSYLETLAERIQKYEIKSHIYEDRDNFVLFIRRKESLESFFRHMYTDADILLTRKYEKYMDFYNLLRLPA